MTGYSLFSELREGIIVSQNIKSYRLYRLYLWILDIRLHSASVYIYWKLLELSMPCLRRQSGVSTIIIMVAQFVQFSMYLNIGTVFTVGPPALIMLQILQLTRYCFVARRKGTATPAVGVRRCYTNLMEKCIRKQRRPLVVLLFIGPL